MPNSPVVAFLIPLRPKGEKMEVWDATCLLLRQTLSSLVRQSNPEWMAVIAGHDRPVILDEFDDPRIQFHTVDFDFSSHGGDPHVDKCFKIDFAAMKACQLRPSYQMVVDADDLLHRELVAEIASHSEVPAIVFDRGWEIDLSLGRAVRRNCLASICGSTAALSTRWFPMPEGREIEEWWKVPWHSHGHNEIKAMLQKKGLSYYSPPKRLVAYLSGHISSLWGRHLKHRWKRLLGFRLLGKPVGAKFHEDFGEINLPR